MEKHQTTEFVIPQETSTLLKEKVERIRSLFHVDVTLTLNPANGQQWICLKGSNEELREKAKSYITSLCREPKRCVKLEIPPRVFEDLKSGNGGKDVEKLAGAVLSFSDLNVFVQGDDFAFALAVSEIERRIAAFRERNELDTASVKCVDSDDLEIDSENIPAKRSTVDTTDIPPSMRDFARKLYYKDKEIDAVIRTFGTEININQLLQELVKNSASTLQLSSASEDTNMFPVARGSCPSGSRVLNPRGAIPAISTRRLAVFEGDQHVQPFQAENLRPIVIDGSNVAMNHGNQQVFSCRGIRLCVEYFRKRGHIDITVFVPMWRKKEPRPETPIWEQEILDELSRQNVLKFTPSRSSGNRLIVCYDDKYIVDLADQNGGIIVSNDGFRDLVKECPRWKETIEQRTLMYTFAGDRFMPPDDPLGRRGPSLDDFLRKGSATHPKICPYLKNCTFGSRCKYYHPERDTQRQQETASVTITQENPELPAATSASERFQTRFEPRCTVGPSTASSANENHPRNIVRDPRVSPRVSPELQNPELPAATSSSERFQTRFEPRCTVGPSTVSSANENHPRNIVRDPRVSPRVPPELQNPELPAATSSSERFQTRFEPRCTVGPSTASSANENHPRNIVRDPRVPISSFSTLLENRRRPDEIGVRGSGQIVGASYDPTCVRNGSEQYQPYYGGNAYSDYHHPVTSDYTARNLQYQEQPPRFHPDMRQFPQLPPAPWTPYPPQVPYPPPAGVGYPAGAGQCTYVRTYYEPAPPQYRNYQGQGLPRDQVDSGKSGEPSMNQEKFDSLVEKLKNVCENEETIFGVLRDHPHECADEEIDKLAGFLLDAVARLN